MLTTVLSPIQLRIQPPQPDPRNSSKPNRQPRRRDIHNKRGDVPWRAVVQITTPDIGRVAHSINQRDGTGPLHARLRQTSRDPRQDDDGGGVEGAR